MQVVSFPRKSMVSFKYKSIRSSLDSFQHDFEQLLTFVVYYLKDPFDLVLLLLYLWFELVSWRHQNRNTHL